MKHKKKKTIFLFMEYAFIFGFTFLLFHYIFRVVNVVGDSMYPTMHDGDVGIIETVSSKGDLARFDIVVVDSNVLDKYVVKRIIGLPGEEVEYINGVLFIDGVITNEYFLDSKYIEESLVKYNTEYFINNYSMELGDNEYFVLGDNRPNSTDSRSFGPVTIEEIIGKDGLIVYPFHHMAWFD